MLIEGHRTQLPPLQRVPSWCRARAPGASSPGRPIGGPLTAHLRCVHAHLGIFSGIPVSAGIFQTSATQIRLRAQLECLSGAS